MRAVADVAAEDDPALDAAAEMLHTLERRHGVSLQPYSHARRALDASDAEEIVPPFFEETWLAFPCEWIGEVDLVADGRSVTTSRQRWASLVATWISAKTPKRFSYLNFSSLNDADAVVDGYAPFMAKARRIVEHAWIVRGVVEMPVDVVGVGSLVTLKSPHDTWAWTVRMVATDGTDGTNAAVAVTSDLGRALVGARTGDVVESGSYGSLAVLAIRRA